MAGVPKSASGPARSAIRGAGAATEHIACRHLLLVHFTAPVLRSSAMIASAVGCAVPL